MIGVRSRLKGFDLNGMPSPRGASPRRRFKLPARQVPHAGNQRSEWEDSFASSVAMGLFGAPFDILASLLAISSERCCMIPKIRL